MHDTYAPMKYVKIWGILLVLLAASVIGPMFERPTVTLITAFGIALVKAALVVTYFMHLNLEKRYIRYMLYAMVLMLGLLFAGTAPDVMQASGLRWQNQAVQQLIDEHAVD
jgi:caa(3)-type oxidase subunit IV